MVQDQKLLRHATEVAPTSYVEIGAAQAQSEALQTQQLASPKEHPLDQQLKSGRGVERKCASSDTKLNEQTHNRRTVYLQGGEYMFVAKEHKWHCNGTKST